MKLRFTPVRADAPMTGSVAGDVITLGGVVIDLSPLQEGGTLPHGSIVHPCVFGDVERRDGDIYLTVACYHGANAPHETRFPSAEYIDVEGEIPFPAYNETEAQ
ncbi:hypothetical protein Q4S47_00665 [Aeromonas caviae]|uniref:hypothetical protein n=1 Tax=Aeromonas caviae TaxID=648 RepID=UPI00300567AF